MMSAALSSHFISFYRQPTRRNWVKATCSCGWNLEGVPAEVYGKAACHDLDIEPPNAYVKDNGQFGMGA